jgi:OmpA-OmpF porin, OOP family
MRYYPIDPKAGRVALSAIMKKGLLPLLLLVIIGHTHLQAQVRLGIMGGVQTAKVLEKNNIPGWDTAVKPFNNSRTGFELGVILEVPIGHSRFFFQPGILYSTKGRIYDRTNDSIAALNSDTIFTKQSLKMGYVEIPFNLTYKIPLTRNHRNSLFISAGPYFSFIYSGSMTTQSLTNSGTGSNTVADNTYNSDTEPVSVGKGPNTYKTWDIGVNTRAGFELGNLMISAYFSHGFTNFYNADYYPYTGTYHHQVMGISAGLWLSSSGNAAPIKKRDTDRDGVDDEEDGCPLQPGPPENHGCPTTDTDHDGIDDLHDSCRTIPGLARYNGCPIPDTDHDGIDDEHDSCPTVPGLARYNGCPIPDRDHDGVNDEIDKCPDIAGPPENHGCPLPPPAPEIKQEATEQVNFIAHNILFKSASDHLTDSSYIALDQLATLLLAHAEWHLTIEGYTDNSGAQANNLLLSRKRAAAVKDYLVKKGVAEIHLSSAGYGQAKPIADNRTPTGKAANRRVELKLAIEKSQF